MATTNLFSDDDTTGEEDGLYVDADNEKGIIVSNGYYDATIDWDIIVKYAPSMTMARELDHRARIEEMR